MITNQADVQGGGGHVVYLLSWFFVCPDPVVSRGGRTGEKHRADGSQCQALLAKPDIKGKNFLP